MSISNRNGSDILPLEVNGGGGHDGVEEEEVHPSILTIRNVYYWLILLWT